MKKALMVAAMTAFSSAAFAADAPAGDAAAGQASYGSCAACHGANGEGGIGPKLAGQAPADIVAKLVKYKNGEQVGAQTAMMAPMATPLSEADMANIAAFVATLK